jgi:adenylate kinase
MVKVFISNIDTPFGHQLSYILSQTAVGSRSGGGDEEVEQDEQTQSTQAAVGADGTVPPAKEKAPKERYIVTGSFLPDVDASVETAGLLRPVYAKPGKMIETGDKKKDTARREAIEKIPTKGVKPKWVSECVPVRGNGD